MQNENSPMSLSEKIILEDLKSLPHRLASGFDVLRSLSFLSASERLAKYEQLNASRAAIRHLADENSKNPQKNKTPPGKTKAWLDRLRAKKVKLAQKILGFELSSVSLSAWSFPLAAVSLAVFLVLTVFAPIAIFPLVIFAAFCWGEGGDDRLLQPKEHENFVSEILHLVEKSPASKEYIQKNPHLLTLIEHNLINRYYARELMCSIARFLTEKRQSEKSLSDLSFLKNECGLHSNSKTEHTTEDSVWIVQSETSATTHPYEEAEETASPASQKSNLSSNWRI